MAVRTSALRILVVDQDEAILSRLTDVLQGAGYEVLTALDSVQAEARVNEGPIDLVITDLAMPEEAGLKMIAAIQNENPELKIMAMTEESSPEVLRAADILGVSGRGEEASEGRDGAAACTRHPAGAFRRILNLDQTLRHLDWYLSRAVAEGTVDRHAESMHDGQQGIGLRSVGFTCAVQLGVTLVEAILSKQSPSGPTTVCQPVWEPGW